MEGEEKRTQVSRLDDFVEDRDFYFDENGLMVLTSHFLLIRGYCCGNGCRHCPYGEDRRPGSE